MENKHERTLIIVKPDAIHRNLLGEIIHRFEIKGLKIVGLKMMELGDVILEEHYAHHVDKPFFKGLKDFMKSAPVVLMCLEGYSAVEAVRTVVGPYKGHEAAGGTIRGDFSLSSQSNVVHASDSIENAKIEIDRFFNEDEIFSYSRGADGSINADDEK